MPICRLADEETARSRLASEHHLGRRAEVDDLLGHARGREQLQPSHPGLDPQEHDAAVSEEIRVVPELLAPLDQRCQ
jgi:hypothetical protein